MGEADDGVDDHYACLPCRRQRQTCDGTLPKCARCRRSRRSCTWAGATSLSSRSSTNRSYARTPLTHEIDLSNLSYFRTTGLSTSEAEQIVFYLSQFHKHSHQMCAWTDLLELPKRSTIPPIARGNKRKARGLTNWANYYLPHLATGANDDPLSLAMVVLTAYKLKQHTTAIIFYAKVIHLLRQSLRKQECMSINDQEYLKLWATTLLLAEYEAQQGNQRVRANHIDGATTLCFLIRERQTRGPSQSPPEADDRSTSSTSNDCPDEATPDRSESRMPKQVSAYLQELTQRHRHSSTICLPIETEWPKVQRAESDKCVMTGLLSQSAECFAHCMQVIELYFNRLNNDPPQTEEEIATIKRSFAPQLSRARAHLAIYDNMLDDTRESANIYRSCSQLDVPFSPIIRFGNPHMVQAHLVPHVLKVLLCPFISPEEHEASLRFISGVYAGLESASEFQVDSAYPDIYIFAFWKAGSEREYFAAHISGRHQEFQRLIHRIWGIIDATEARSGHPLTSTDIVRLTMQEYKAAQTNAVSTGQARYFQVEGLMARTWAVAIGSDPSANFVDGPHTHKYRKRIKELRESFQRPGGQDDRTKVVFAFRESGPLRSQEVEYIH